jgi:hypothetical protein
LPHTGFEFLASGEIVTWSRILSAREALIVVNANGAESRGGDVVVAAELSRAGSEFRVIANTAQAAADGAFQGTHPVGSKLTVKRPGQSGPAFVEIRSVPPSEVLVLISE